MNKIWGLTVILCSLLIVVRAPSEFLGALQSGAGGALTLSLGLLPVYALWGGVIQITESSGLKSKLVRLIAPATKRLFPNESILTQNAISMTMIANMIGLGGVATPLAIEATRMMDDGSRTATKSQLLFCVINATSLSIVPTTVISMLTAHGSTNAGTIILPTVISSTVATVLAVLTVSLLKK